MTKAIIEKHDDHALTIHLLFNDQEVGRVYLDVNNDIEEQGADENEWLVSYQNDYMDDPNIIDQGHFTPKK